MCHVEFGDQEKVFICQLDLIYLYHDNAVGTAFPGADLSAFVHFCNFKKYFLCGRKKKSS